MCYSQGKLSLNLKCTQWSHIVSSHFKSCQPHSLNLWTACVPFHRVRIVGSSRRVWGWRPFAAIFSGSPSIFSRCIPSLVPSSIPRPWEPCSGHGLMPLAPNRRWVRRWNSWFCSARQRDCLWYSLDKDFRTNHDHPGVHERMRGGYWLARWFFKISGVNRFRAKVALSNPISLKAYRLAFWVELFFWVFICWYYTCLIH